MSRTEARRLLILEPALRRYRLRLLGPDTGSLLFNGEALSQQLLREDPGALIIARGPMPFLSGNKTTVGYISPLTQLPHYSFVGGRSFAELVNLGLDAIVLSGAAVPDRTGPDAPSEDSYVVVSGRAPHLIVEWKSATELPTGQRGAYHWLLERELAGQPERGSIFTIGEAARWRTANLAVDALYHAGRGGAGRVFSRFASALILRGEPLSWQAWFGPRAGAFWELREGEMRERLEDYTERLSRQDGGTVTKLEATGTGDRPTLPARNASRLGYSLADLGGSKVLRATRAGQTGCHWCQVNCRHWHWVEADYAPDGRDRLLDDFEPAYAILAMLDLQPASSSLQDKLRLLKDVDERVILPIEQMGCDVIDVGVGLAALFEGLERRLLPLDDVPAFLQSKSLLGNLELAARAVAALRAGDASPALRAVGDGPQALAAEYPATQKILFTCGPGTLGNAGHANALWTFLMPFSRYFSHYAGQLYKVAGKLPTGSGLDEVQLFCERVIRQVLRREVYGCLGNMLSTCAFTFVIFSQDGEGMTLDDTDLLVRTLALYGIETRREELQWAAEAFWAQSIAFKLELGWRPPAAVDLPARVFEALSLALERPVDELRMLMDKLIATWKRQAGEILYKYGHQPAEDW
jgi:aldehyde:ferredoxin oxidoreductase